MEETEFFDSKALVNRLMGDEELAAEILKEFWKDVQEQISNLKQAVAAKDEGLIKLHAHTIKGSAANVGAVGLQQVALDVERSAEAGDVTNVAVLMVKVEEQIGFLEGILA